MKKLLLMISILFISSSAFPQWFPLSSGTNERIRSIHFPDINTGYAVGFNGMVLKTSDGGSTWTQILSGTSTDWYYSVYFTDSLTGYVAGDKVWQCGVILKTVDGGITWNSFNSNAKYLTSIFFVDANNGYAVGDTTILKTTNAGSTWTTLISGVNEVLRTVYFPDLDTGYIVGNAGTILKTTNGGANWIDLSIGGNTTLCSVFFTDPETGYAVGYNGLIIKTDNGGTSWSTKIIGSGDFYSIFFTNPNTGYTAGSFAPMLKTCNGGTDWWSLLSGSYYEIYSICFVNADTGYAAGENGTILKTINGGGFFEGVNDLSSESTTLIINPNPASTLITIGTPVNPINGRLSIVNPTGQEILSQHITDMKTVIDISTLPNGVYFVKLSNDKKVEVGKFIKQ
jgi:photosystem II stability/assembly factor-like uncharacterized protein